MTKTFNAQIDAWVRKSEKRLDVVVRGATQDVISRASRTARGVTRGGSVKRGYVPRDIGTLAASLISTLHGSTAMTQGNGEYALVVASMQAGDKATFVWTAPHARPMHYGYTTSRGNFVGGWMWVDEAAGNWQRIVGENVLKARARVK